MFWRTALLLAAILTSASAAEIDSAALLVRVRSKFLRSVKTIPRYVCRQNLERQTFAPVRKPPKTCGTLSEAGFGDPAKSDAALALPAGKPGYVLIASDRANLDVMVADGTELFSWPGGGRFQTNNPDDLLGGGFAGNGDFASFLTTVFASGQTAFEYRGPCGATSCVRYSYDVPVAVSRYVIENPVEKVATGYHGTFDVDSDSGDLLAATVIPTDLSTKMKNICDVRTRMTYTRSSAEFTIPDTATKEYLDANGWYGSNWIQYTGCRQYSAASTLSFGDNAPATSAAEGAKAAALPRSGTTLELRLATKLDTGLNTAGDPVEATLVRAVPAAGGRAIPAGTVIRGHLAQVERTYVPKPAVKIVIRFDTIVSGGIPIPLALSAAGKMDARGRGVFTFSRARVMLDSQFVSRWRVR